MNNIKSFTIITLGMLTLLSSCKQTALEKSLEAAGENRAQLQAVLDIYSENPKDSLKLRAAKFLIESMRFHASSESKAIEVFDKRLAAQDTTISAHTADGWWNDILQKYSDSTLVYPDVTSATTTGMIRNIERAFTVWQRSPWHKEVDFDMFCRYILPYRFSNEMYSENWREYLYEKYYPVIEGETDVRKAFAKLHTLIWVRNSDGMLCRAPLTPVALDKVDGMLCHQCCVLLGSVCRAVGIPVAMDNVRMWANYSLRGHAWIALIRKDGTYTVNKYDTIATKLNGVYGTDIGAKHAPDKDYPFKAYFKKRVSRVWRSEFVPDEEFDNSNKLIKSLFSPYHVDVSTEYGMKGTLHVETDYPTDYAFLCNFRTGNDWLPTDYNRLKDGKTTFYGLGDSIMYIPMVYYRNELRPTAPPFIFSNGRKISFVPDTKRLRTVRLLRKYPLIPRWFNRWWNMRDTYFEASDDSCFRTSTRLYTIHTTPAYPNRVRLADGHKFRYVRYVCGGKSMNLEYLSCLSQGRELKYRPIGRIQPEHIDSLYLKGIDLGASTNITELLYLPKTDGNFITRGHIYELFYYDMKWISLGRQRAAGYDALTFKQVPAHAVLFLKDITVGEEERIFTYEDGEQVWW